MRADLVGAFGFLSTSLAARFFELFVDALVDVLVDSVLWAVEFAILVASSATPVLLHVPFDTFVEEYVDSTLLRAADALVEAMFIYAENPEIPQKDAPEIKEASCRGGVFHRLLRRSILIGDQDKGADVIRTSTALLKQTQERQASMQ